jgi:hypothetical protein
MSVTPEQIADAQRLARDWKPTRWRGGSNPMGRGEGASRMGFLPERPRSGRVLRRGRGFRGHCNFTNMGYNLI